MKKIAILFSILGALASCAPTTIPDEAPPAREGCGDDHPRVGQSAEFVGRQHDVSGSLRVIDNCTLEITNFVYDGGGVDVRAIASPNRDYQNGIVLSEDLRRAGGYENESVQLNLPEGVTLDDVQGLSIWCVPFGADFGEAQFE